MIRYKDVIKVKMTKFVLLVLALVACSCLISKPDGTCTPAGFFIRPDICGTKIMIAEWAKVGGVDSPVVKRCNAVAEEMNLRSNTRRYTGLLWCDGAKPVNHCVCHPMSFQYASDPPQ